MLRVSCGEDACMNAFLSVFFTYDTYVVAAFAKELASSYFRRLYIRAKLLGIKISLMTTRLAACPSADI